MMTTILKAIADPKAEPPLAATPRQRERRALSVVGMARAFDNDKVCNVGDSHNQCVVEELPPTGTRQNELPQTERLHTEG